MRKRRKPRKFPSPVRTKEKDSLEKRVVHSVKATTATEKQTNKKK